MGEPIKLKNVRISFPSLLEPNEYKGSKRYRAHFIIEKGSEADKLINEEIGKVANAAWTTKAAGILKSIKGNNMKYVYQNGSAKGYGENSMYLSASSPKKPSVFNKDKTRASEGNCDIYSGCYVDAVVTIYTTKEQGIAAGLSGVLFINDGEAFGGGYVATPEDFGIDTSNDVLGA